MINLYCWIRSSNGPNHVLEGAEGKRVGGEPLPEKSQYIHMLFGSDILHVLCLYSSEYDL